MGSATVSFKHDCGQQIIIDKIWTPGGVNDTGGYVLKCKGCDGVFAYHLGRDINDSRVASGAEQLDSYDDGVGDKALVLARHGLTE